MSGNPANRSINYFSACGWLFGSCLVWVHVMLMDMCHFFWQPTYLQFVKPIQYTQFSMYTHITLAVSAVESLVSLRACGAKVLYYSLVFPSIWMKEIRRITYHFYYYSICTSCFVCLIKPEHNNNISNQWGELKEKLNKNESGKNVERIDERSVCEKI